MLFAADVRFYNDFNGKEDLQHLFVCAEKFTDAIEKISGWYGEEAIESIDITAFSPYDMLVYETDEDETLYYETKDSLGEKVLW